MTQGQPRPPRRRAVEGGATRARQECPKCGRLTAWIIGRSESVPVLYLRCDECRHTSIAPA